MWERSSSSNCSQFPSFLFCQYIPLSLVSELLGPEVAFFRVTFKTAQSVLPPVVSIGPAGNLHILSSDTRLTCRLLYGISLLCSFQISQSSRIWGRDGVLIAEPIHCTDRYPPGEWDASSTTHSYFPGVTLSGSLTWFEEMRIFLSFSLTLSLSLSFSCSFSFTYFSGFCLYRQTGPGRRLDEMTIEGRKSSSLPLSLNKPWKQQSGCCCLPCSF